MGDPAHIHRGGDGRVNRVTHLNGKVVDNVVFADERRGIVEQVMSPVRLNRWEKRILTRRLRGKVIVRPVDENQS